MYYIHSKTNNMVVLNQPDAFYFKSNESLFHNKAYSVYIEDGNETILNYSQLTQIKLYWNLHMDSVPIVGTEIVDSFVRLVGDFVKFDTPKTFQEVHDDAMFKIRIDMGSRKSQKLGKYDSFRFE